MARFSWNRTNARIEKSRINTAAAEAQRQRLRAAFEQLSVVLDELEAQMKGRI